MIRYNCPSNRDQKWLLPMICHRARIKPDVAVHG
jgi:hypothetical protein